MLIFLQENKYTIIYQIFIFGCLYNFFTFLSIKFC